MEDKENSYYLIGGRWLKGSDWAEMYGREEFLKKTQAVLPVAKVEPVGEEIAELKEQVAELRRQVEELQKIVRSLAVRDSLK